MRSITAPFSRAQIKFASFKWDFFLLINNKQYRARCRVTWTTKICPGFSLSISLASSLLIYSAKGVGIWSFFLLVWIKTSFVSQVIIKWLFIEGIHLPRPGRRRREMSRDLKRIKLLLPFLLLNYRIRQTLDWNEMERLTGPLLVPHLKIRVIFFPYVDRRLLQSRSASFWWVSVKRILGSLRKLVIGRNGYNFIYFSVPTLSNKWNLAIFDARVNGENLNPYLRRQKLSKAIYERGRFYSAIVSNFVDLFVIKEGPAGAKRCLLQWLPHWYAVCNNEAVLSLMTEPKINELRI